MREKKIFYSKKNTQDSKYRNISITKRVLTIFEKSSQKVRYYINTFLFFKFILLILKVNATLFPSFVNTQDKFLR